MLLATAVFAGDYTLVWNEDFTDGALDTNVWNIEVNGDGGGNNELQYYCEKGVSIERNPLDNKQCLVLTATKEDYNGRKCTSGRVNSKHNACFTYGKVEARIWFPKTADGLWPAFWMLGENIDQVGWPKCGETDIIEMGHKDGFNGRQETYFNGAMHVGAAWNSVWQDVSAKNWDYSLQDGFHILTCEWEPDTIRMYVDKDKYPEKEPYFATKLASNTDVNYDRALVWSKPNFIIFNLAVGGNFPGIYDINKVTALSRGARKMYVDWVRVYQKGDPGQTAHFASESDPVEEVNPQAVEQVQGSDNQGVTKQIINGRLIIVRGNAAYDVMGAMYK